MSINLHHANLLVGASEEAELYLRSLCENLGFKLVNSPDFFAFRMNIFGIDEARELKSLSAHKAIIGRKIFFISPVRLTLEAQNALLKTFEDPFPNTYFFLVTREETLIVPTLLSRMQVVHVDTKWNFVQAEEFLSLSLKDRLLFAKKFVEEEKSLPDFLDGLLFLLRKRGEPNALMESIYKMSRFTRDSAVLPRLIIEHLSLVL